MLYSDEPINHVSDQPDTPAAQVNHHRDISNTTQPDQQTTPGHIGAA